MLYGVHDQVVVDDKKQPTQDSRSKGTYEQHRQHIGAAEVVGKYH